MSIHYTNMGTDDVDMLDNLGMLYLIKGDYEQTQQLINRLKPLKPALAKEPEILIRRMQAKGSRNG